MRMNVGSAVPRARTHEGGPAQRVSPIEELRRAVLTCLLWENTFYESGSDLAKRIANLVPQCKPDKVQELSIYARDDMYLRHVPLFLLSELSKIHGAGPLVHQGLAHCIQRADELGEFMKMYWKDGRHPLSSGVKRGLRDACRKFNAYHLAKYNRSGPGVVTLKDVFRLVHPVADPNKDGQVTAFKQLMTDTLPPADTWEVALSGGKGKKETWERLIKEGKLGGLAALRNLRNMDKVGVDKELIRERLRQPIKRALPFRFIAAARYAPHFEPELEQAMLGSAETLASLPGSTGFLIDVSGSMECELSAKSEMTREDAASGLAILLREKADECFMSTFSNGYAVVPPRRGFALRDAIHTSQAHGATYLAAALKFAHVKDPHWKKLDRIIVITDEQSHDGVYPAWTPKAYMINVAGYKNGVGYGQGFTHINGWSERIVDYILAVENEHGWND